MTKLSRLPLNTLAAQLSAGRPVLLLPVFAPLQAPDPIRGLVMVSRLHAMAAPGLLRLDLDGDCGLLLVEERHNGLHNA